MRNAVTARMIRRTCRVALFAALVIMVACGFDPHTGQPGGKLDTRAAAHSALDEAPSRSKLLSPALRAAYVTAVQRGAGIQYALATTPKLDGQPAAASGHNTTQGFDFELSRAGLVVGDGEGVDQRSLELRWTGLGRGTAVEPVAEADAIEVNGNWASLARAGGLAEWYLNGPLGLEQGFTLNERPAGKDGELIIELSVAGDEPPVLSADGKEVLLGGADSDRLHYSDLFAQDAAGRALDAHMRVTGTTIQLVIDDAMARYPLVVDPLVWVEQQKLVAPDATAFDRFGYAVALSSDTALIGARLDDDKGSASGSAYVFVRTGTTWAQQQKLYASDGAAFDYFGSSVAVDGDTALVGATGNDEGGSMSGSAYVFVRDNMGQWTEQERLLVGDPTAGDQLGSSVSVSGDSALISAHLDDGTVGSAYVFVRNGFTWTEQKKLVASDGAIGDYFGQSVALGGDTALVGSWGNSSLKGAAYVFFRKMGVWTEQKKLVASDGATGDYFGYSVSLSGDTALVGAYLGTGGSCRSGSSSHEPRARAALPNGCGARASAAAICRRRANRQQRRFGALGSRAPGPSRSAGKPTRAQRCRRRDRRRPHRGRASQTLARTCDLSGCRGGRDWWRRAFHFAPRTVFATRRAGAGRRPDCPNTAC